jgi:hypothetical protein
MREDLKRALKLGDGNYSPSHSALKKHKSINFHPFFTAKPLQFSAK